MDPRSRIFIVNNIKLPLNASHEEAFSVAKSRFKRLGLNVDELCFSLFRRSTDARNKKDIKFVYSVAVSGILPNLSEDKLKFIDATRLEHGEIGDVTIGTHQLVAPPIVVGSGPCGLFAALFLAEQGYQPILIERGGSVEERKIAVDRFNSFHVLDPETNIQFGAGGAGTFSDGKLVTRINDPLSDYVLRRFVEFGAPEEILYLARPHIGTDILSKVVSRMLDRFTQLGGKLLYHTKLTGIEYRGKASIAKTTNGDIEFGAIILAIGHSARDTYTELIRNGFMLEAKNFSVGMRIEHLREDIDKSMYGDFAGHPALGHAEYNLSYNTKERGVYTFCMCPGGEVVAAASEQGGVVVNGMSHHSRDGKNSNSAVVCSVFKEDYGSTPTKAIEFQRAIEQSVFRAGGGGFAAPVILVGDFINEKCSEEPRRILPTYMNGENVKLASPEQYLPGFVTDSIKKALVYFDGKIKNFACNDAVLTGAETRTSAPVRILRNNETRTAPGYDNVYPAGEGAGYAGGITSAAIDGLKSAIALVNRYKPINR